MENTRTPPNSPVCPASPAEKHKYKINIDFPELPRDSSAAAHIDAILRDAMSVRTVVSHDPADKPLQIPLSLPDLNAKHNSWTRKDTSDELCGGDVYPGKAIVKLFEVLPCEETMYFHFMYVLLPGGGDPSADPIDHQWPFICETSRPHGYCPESRVARSYTLVSARSG